MSDSEPPRDTLEMADEPGRNQGTLDRNARVRSCCGLLSASRGRPGLNHNTVIHEDERITDFAAESHLMGDHCNSWLILNVSGGPTFNNPDVTMTPPPASVCLTWARSSATPMRWIVRLLPCRVTPAR